MHRRGLFFYESTHRSALSVVSAGVNTSVKSTSVYVASVDADAESVIRDCAHCLCR